MTTARQRPVRGMAVAALVGALAGWGGSEVMEPSPDWAGGGWASEEAAPARDELSAALEQLTASALTFGPGDSLETVEVSGLEVVRSDDGLRIGVCRETEQGRRCQWAVRSELEQ